MMAKLCKIAHIVPAASVIMNRPVQGAHKNISPQGERSEWPSPLTLSLSRFPDSACSRTIHVFPPGGLLLGGVGFQGSRSGAFEGSLLVVRFFLNRHALSMTQDGVKIEECR